MALQPFIITTGSGMDKQFIKKTYDIDLKVPVFTNDRKEAVTYAGPEGAKRNLYEAQQNITTCSV